MQTHIQKWGNSLGIRIPIQLAKQLHLYAGSSVNIRIEEEGRLVIETPQYDLKTMIDAITPENQHHLFLDDNNQKGHEEW